VNDGDVYRQRNAALRSGPTRARQSVLIAAALAGLVILAGCSRPATETPPASPSGTAPELSTAPSIPSTTPGTGGFDPATKFTPLSVATLTTPGPVKASDGRIHLAYELILTNASGLPFTLERLEMRDASTNRSLLTMSGKALNNGLTSLSNPSSETPSTKNWSTMAPSTSTIAWLDVSFAAEAEVPKRLEHRAVGTLTRPDGERLPLDLLLGGIDTSPRPATMLSAPVQNGIWYMSEGCCRDDTHHRRGLVPINGQLMVAQRFAIDLYLLDEQHRTWVGDPKKLASYLSYRKPIMAAAAGTVVDAKDGLPNTTSLPKPPPIPPIESTVGNHVIIELEPGTYALYAHMDTGSVKVKVGQRVEKGEQLGVIGSSGNSTVPHLHFQLLTTPTFFPSDSQPYVWDTFELLGKVPKRLWDDNLGLQQTGELPFEAAQSPGQRTGELPLDRAVIRFGAGR
jgi:Peptidase family M23